MRGNTVDFVPSEVSYRNAFGSVFLPYLAQLEAVAGPSLDAMMPYAFDAFDSATLPGLVAGFVGPQDTQLSGFSTPEDCWLTHIVASGVVEGGVAAPSFAVQFYDAGRQKLLNPQPILAGNSTGSARQPFWLKKLYKLPAGQQFQCRVTNFLATNTAIQVILWGLRSGVPVGGLHQ